MAAPTVFKECSRCEESKPDTEFYLGETGERVSPCKACKTEYRRELRRREAKDKRAVQEGLADRVSALEAGQAELGRKIESVENLVRSLRDLLVSQGSLRL